MKLTTTYKNLKSRETLNRDIEKTFEKFENYFDNELICKAKVSIKGKEETGKCVEITIISGKFMFRAESTTDDFYKSIDEDFEKIKKQIRRQKDKLIAKKHKGIDVDMGASESLIEDDQFIIVRKKTFKIMPMNVEEAALQMESLGHTFFMFYNADEEEINVIYKRDNGGYGLIQMQE